MTAKKRAGKVQRVVVNKPKGPEQRKTMKIHVDTLAHARMKSKENAKQLAATVFKLPITMKGVKSSEKMAMDDAISDQYSYAVENTIFSEGLAFLGYPYLSELIQRPEYRRPAEILAKEMTRKWIKLQTTGEEDKSDKLKAIESEMKRLNLQSVTRKVLEHDGWFGRGQVYLDMGDEFDDPELISPLTDVAEKIPKGGLKRLANVEPIWTYPQQYETLNPFDEHFYKPETWSVMGKEIHSSRLLTVVSRPVPDLLKPAYSFGGLSLTQMGKPYVDNWLRTRQAVSDLIHNFSVRGIKTNMDAALSGAVDTDIFARVDLFNATADNQGLMVLNQDEEYFNVSTPLSGLDSLQAQSQEHMSAVFGIPLVVLLGITPSGLNASSDGEMRAFFNWIESQQEVIRPFLSRILNVIQLSLFGEIDPEIDFKFEPLWSMDEKEIAEIRKIEMDTDIAGIEASILHPEEARGRLANQEDSPYAGIDLTEEPEPSSNPEDDEEMQSVIDEKE